MAEFTQARKKDETISMIKDMISKNGNDLVISAIPVNQGPGAGLYTSTTSVEFLNSCIERLPRNHEHTDGIQRALKYNNVREIKEGHKKSRRYDTPNSITIMLRENCEYYEVQDIAVIKGMKCIVVHLDKMIAYLESEDAEADVNGFLLDPEQATIGYMIDGHHRNEGAYLAALEEAEKFEYEFPTSIYIGRKKADMPGIFNKINDKQQKPSTTHTTAIRAMSGDMDKDEEDANAVMELLNEREDSVLRGRIKVFDGRLPKGAPATFVNNAKMIKLVQDWWEVAKMYNSSYKCKSTNDKYNFINEYLSAYEEVFPEAWDDQKHVLTKSMGFDVIFSIFDALTTQIVTTAKVQRLPDKDDFVLKLRELFFEKDKEGNIVPVKIIIDGENEVPFDWDSETFGALSNGKGVGILKKIVKNLIATRTNGAAGE